MYRNLKDLTDSAKGLVEAAQSLASHWQGLMQEEKFKQATLILPEIAIAADRAEAGKIILSAVKREQISELNKKSAEQLLHRLQAELKAFPYKATSPAFSRTMTGCITSLKEIQ